MPFDLPAQDDKPAYVRAMFDRISGAYDRVNDLMTAGRHRAWKRTMIRLVRTRPGGRYLDLCTGTGDIAFLLAIAAQSPGAVTAVDFSPGMLEQAMKRPWNGPEIAWRQGDAEHLPFEDATFDGVTVGFGLRNVRDLDRAIAEIRRVLKPGGRFVSLDLGKPRTRALRWGAEVYEYRVVPLLGSMVSGDRSAYEYLPHSNSRFPDQRELARRLQAQGFTDVEVRDRMLGAVALVSGTAQ
jgi:demethylmenaquinone methyltransferase/2-methoxy-6-polyprenyl-1,4-benzoquinol methylase